MPDNILITGGAGYIGAHLAARLLERGARVIALDDLSNGSLDALVRAERLGAGWIEREIGDLCDAAFVSSVLDRWPVDAVVHLAAQKSVAGSWDDPEGTRRINVHGTETLAEALAARDIQRVVHASTAAVYGTGPGALDEASPLEPLSPYARTKLEAEAVLQAAAEAFGWSIVNLRFFNVCGAHPSGQLGERLDNPTNLVPTLLRAAHGDRRVEVFGTDYPTPDGTCVRDYVHVEDIVGGIEAALAHTARVPGAVAVNLGTGRGHTVREVISAVEGVTGIDLGAEDGPRRAGDPPASIAAVDRAAELLGWRAAWSLEAMVHHAWRWSHESAESAHDTASSSPSSSPTPGE